MSSSDWNIKRSCPECGSDFRVRMDAPSIDERLFVSQLKDEWVSVNGKMYRLTWYDCPSCGLRIFVQADDKRTENLLRKCKDVITRMNDKSTHRWDNSKKQSEYLKKLRSDLAASRRRVENEITGRAIVDRHTGTAHRLVFYHE